MGAAAFLRCGKKFQHPVCNFWHRRFVSSMRRAEALFCPHPMERSKQRMLSTLVSLYKLLGTGNFFKVLLLLLKAFFA